MSRVKSFTAVLTVSLLHWRCDRLEELKDNFDKFRAEQLGEIDYQPVPGQPAKNFLAISAGESTFNINGTLEALKANADVDQKGL